MNSVVRMIGAGWPDFQARIAAWTSGSSGGTSSPAGFHRLHGARGAEGVDLDDVRHGLVLKTQRDETATQGGDERQLRDSSDLRPPPRANQIEIAIVPFAPGLDVWVQVFHHAIRS